MDSFLKWLIIVPVIAMGIYSLSPDGENLNTNILEKPANADVTEPLEVTLEPEVTHLPECPAPEVESTRSEIDELIQTFKEVCAEGSSEPEQETKTKRKKSCLFRGCKRCRK